jgi:hypothetical protein
VKQPGAVTRDICENTDIRYIEFNLVVMLPVTLPPVNLIPGAIADLFAQVSSTGCITLADRYGLMAALLDDSLEEEEQRCIDRLIRALYRGRVKMVDEISAVM